MMDHGGHPGGHRDHGMPTGDARTLDGAESLQRQIQELMSNRFGVYFSTVQVETECLETEESAAIDFSAEPAQP